MDDGITIQIDQATKRKFKAQCIMEGVSMTDKITEWIQEWIQSDEKQTA